MGYGVSTQLNPVSQRLAIIDLGTNTFHLLVAELEGNHFKILYIEREAVKIGMGGINDGIITDAAIARALTTLRGFKDALTPFQPSRILAFGTSALRNAKNGGAVAEKIKQHTGIECKIISGDEEADYIYYGVRAAIKLGNEKSLIVDIGGGSVEFIIGNQNEIFWKRSFEIGGQRLLERFQKHDPISKEELEHLYHYLSENLKELFQALQQHPVKTLVGSSGTFDTLSDIYCIREGISQGNTPETPLTLSSFYEIYEQLLSKNRAERLQIPGMIELRVDMIVVACALIQFLLHEYPFENIRVSSYSLKEGVLASLVG